MVDEVDDDLRRAQRIGVEDAGRRLPIGRAARGHPDRGRVHDDVGCAAARRRRSSQADRVASGQRRGGCRGRAFARGNRAPGHPRPERDAPPRAPHRPRRARGPSSRPGRRLLARASAGSRRRRSSRPRARPSGSRVTVLTLRERGGGGRRARRTASAAAVLCGIVTDRPTRPSVRHGIDRGRVRRRREPRTRRDPVETELAVRRVVQTGRQRVPDRIADHAGDPGRRRDHSTPACLRRSMFCLLFLVAVRRERVVAVLAGEHVVEVVGLGGVPAPPTATCR